MGSSTWFSRISTRRINFLWPWSWSFFRITSNLWFSAFSFRIFLIFKSLQLTVVSIDLQDFWPLRLFRNFRKRVFFPWTRSYYYYFPIFGQTSKNIWMRCFAQFLCELSKDPTCSWIVNASKCFEREFSKKQVRKNLSDCHNLLQIC